MKPSPHPVVIDSPSQREATEELISLDQKKKKFKVSVAQFTDDKWKFTSKLKIIYIIFYRRIYPCFFCRTNTIEKNRFYGYFKDF